jgi:hypothetical protein
MTVTITGQVVSFDSSTGTAVLDDGTGQAGVRLGTASIADPTEGDCITVTGTPGGVSLNENTDFVLTAQEASMVGSGGDSGGETASVASPVYRFNDEIPDGMPREGITREAQNAPVGDVAWRFNEGYLKTDWVWGIEDHSGTLAAWVNIPSSEARINSGRDILSSHDDGQTGNTRFAKLALGQRQEGIGIVKNKVRADRAGAFASYPTGEWFHLAGVVDKEAGELRTYINGQQQATAQDIDIRMEQEGVFAVGAQAKNRAGNYIYNARFVGQIDDVRGYNRVLSDEQIQRLANPQS